MSGLFSIWHDWRERREVFGEIRRQKADAREWAVFKVRDDLTAALTALDMGDHRRATELWANAFDLYPRESRASHLALQVLLGLRRFNEAEALMREGSAKHRGDFHFPLGLAQVAAAAGDYETAVDRFAAVRKQFPAVWQGYGLGVQALCRLNRLQEAEALAERAVSLFDREVAVFMDYSRIADTRQDWEQAVRRWGVVRARFQHLSGYTGAAAALIKLGRYDEAEALLLEARPRYSADPAPVTGLARCAQARGDVPEALERWKRLARHFALSLHSCVESAQALEALGAVAEAEQLLRETAERFQNEQRPLAALGMLLFRRENFAAAVAVWSAMRQNFPNERLGYTQGAEALARAGRVDEAEALRIAHDHRFKSNQADGCMAVDPHILVAAVLGHVEPGS